MRESILKEPRFREEPSESKPREGIVVSTVMRLTTTDGRTFDETEKAMEHEAFYQILKLLVKKAGWADSEESAAFAIKLARHYRTLLPLLNELEKDSDTLRTHLGELQRSI
jgi:hypothetical protein